MAEKSKPDSLSELSLGERALVARVEEKLFGASLPVRIDRYEVVSAIGRDGTWPVVLKVQQFFDDQKAAALEAAEDAAARAEMNRNG